jgi:hypothetical protein
VASPAANDDAPYSVIEVYLSDTGAGTGNLSLAADVVLDEGAGTVALQSAAGAPALLESVQREAAAP